MPDTPVADASAADAPAADAPVVVTPPAADAPPPSWDTQIFDPASPGKLVEGWHAKAPDPKAYEPYASAKSIAEVLEAANKRVTDAQTALRNKPVAPGTLPLRPAADAPPEHWEAYRTAHGLPQKAEDYPISRPPEVAAEIWDDGRVAGFAKFCHDRDVKPEFVQEAIAWFHEDLQKGFGELQELNAGNSKLQREAEAAVLGKVFGANLDPRLKELQSVAQAQGLDPSAFDPASDKYWGVDATRLFAELLDRIPRGEDGTVRNMGAPTANGQYDLAWAKASNDPAHPDYPAWTNPKHPRYAEITRLRNMAYAMGTQQK